MLGFIGNKVPKVNPFYGKRVMLALNKAIIAGTVASCHDCSDGGMAVALAEMAFAGALGMKLKLGLDNRPSEQGMLENHILLFSESNTRFIVETKDEKKFLKVMSGMPVWRLGTVTNDKYFKIYDYKNKLIVSTNINALKSCWQKTFKDF
jgi:phosphoribosylformylglycinamidine synthase